MQNTSTSTEFWGRGRRLPIKLASKTDLRFMRMVGFFSKVFMTDFWTTYRLPFQKHTTIAYSVNETYEQAAARFDMLPHEVIHTILLEKWYGPLLAAFFVVGFPLPVLFSGRWYIERWAYLADIQRGRRTVKQSADILWSGYLWPFPHSWMVSWFEKHAAKWDKSWFDELIVDTGDHDGAGGGTPT